MITTVEKHNEKIYIEIDIDRDNYLTSASQIPQ
jgi:hypothetical protein